MKLTKKLTYEEVRVFIEENSDCTLISTEYINCSQKLHLKCKCGNQFPVTIGHFRDMNKRQCNDCSNQKKSKNQRLSYDDVKKFIEDNGCLLLSTDYVNNSTELDIICSCGTPFKKSFRNFNHCKQRQCPECGNKNRDDKRRTPYDEVKAYIEHQNCILLSTEYINVSSELKIKCSCGEVFRRSFGEFKAKEKQCPQCSLKSRVDKRRMPFEEVKRYIEEQGCSLLTTEYFNNEQLLDIGCVCGETFKRTFSGFKCKEQTRCLECSGKVSKGEEKIELALSKHNIKFEVQYRFEECRNIRPLPFDFAIFNNELKLLCLIEYQGRQHYKPSTFGRTTIFEADENFNLIQKNDQIKKEFCIMNEIKLIEIPHWEFKNIEKILIEEGIIPSSNGNYSESRFSA